MSGLTDRELLEGAARAAGLELVFSEYHNACVSPSDPKKDRTRWNPLTDDGDALRLAVKLGVIIDCRYGDKPGSHNVYVNYWPKGYTGSYLSVSEESSNQLQATRRAIVRAAHAIGVAMDRKDG